VSEHSKPLPIIIPQPVIPGYTTPGYATPLPEFSHSTSPAWNPDSQLAHHDVEPASDETNSTHAPGLHEPKHALLDSRLLDARLKVIVTGGSYNHKELTASIMYVDGRPTISHKSYTTTTPLSPEWVTPKCPNPTRDNGLLVIIKGDHCGKYVRRIHHRYEHDKPVLLLGVVHRMDGHADTLTDERLELDTSFLCLCDESKEDKKRNSSLMDSIRQEARKIRAK